MDRASLPLRLVPDAVDGVGDFTEVSVDCGITSSGDIATCLVLGPRIALVGRPYLCGQMAGGERGVDWATEILTTEILTTEILTTEILTTMRLLRARNVDDLNASHDRRP